MEEEEKKKTKNPGPSPVPSAGFPGKTGTIYPRLSICFNTKNVRMGYGVGELKRRGSKH